MKKPHREFEIYRDMDVPRGGWTFTVEQTGVRFTGPAPKGLAEQVRKHLDANDIPYPPDFREWFEDELCRQNRHGEPWCGPVLPKPDPAARGIGLDDVSRFVQTVWWLARDRFRLVRQQAADARSAVCATCPLNVVVAGGCPKCYAFLTRVSRMLGNRKTASESSLNVCRPCGCVLRLKVWVPDSVLDRAESDLPPAYPAHCWRVDKPKDA